MSDLHRLTLLFCNRITDLGLAKLRGMKQLRELTIIVVDPAQISSQALDKLRRDLPLCEISYSVFRFR